MSRLVGKARIVNVVEQNALRLLDYLGAGFNAGLNDAVKYLPVATEMAELVFPPAVAELTMAQTAVDLLQKAVVTVEQSYAARGQQAGTGKQKLATVLTLSSDAVQGLLIDPDVSSVLKQHGITLSDAMVSTLTSDIVGVLNAKSPSNPAVAKAA